ncbi:PepSY-associated TM helix domain-containing protein [Uliginosibacterium sp. 31-12]|uniref:PepSY-associated TM helix domain-containing protein n=1 Tax=Uliginosibacterium sp. 31-12 TaxID=3062781 RepID=UPI0026E34610|nr:PepSY-associated TM helix domain-containing protein [Uliginosibacterium sp. 31-12]MDO6387843.1 PepSY-associated TM helix domain-containing protein [Uliginosibacterium sp. 31-12]
MRSLIPFLTQAHRWLALLTAPVLLLIILSGLVLAFKPVVESGARPPVDVASLSRALEQADPGHKAGVMSLSSDGTRFVLSARGTGAMGEFDAQSGARVGAAGFDLFGLARNLHTNLLVGAGWLVTLTTSVTVILFLSGFLLGWRRLRNTLSGWHAGLGWLAWPLAALTPVTGLMMAFHLGTASLPHYEAGRPLPLVKVIEIASQQVDLSKLAQVRTFRGGAVMLTVQDEPRAALYLVTSAGELLRSGGPGWVRMLHEGTWAGAFSGLFTFMSTLPLLGLLLTGLLTWWRRHRLLNAAL